MFETLKGLCIKDIENNFNEKIEEIKTEEGFKRVSQWYGKNYTKNPEKKLTKFLENRKNKQIEETLQKFADIETAPDFNKDFVITLEWKKSYTWGYNPTVYTNTGFQYHGISGCGYDKVSTATAYALNSNLSILKLLYQKKEEYLNKLSQNGDEPADFKNGFNRPYLGYGSGYNILPYFEGGVGISSHEHMLNNLGLILNHVSNTSSTDVYIIHLPRK